MNSTPPTQMLGNAAEVPIELAAKPGHTKLEGLHAVPSIGGALVGIWEVAPAEWDVATNEEVFVVLSGSGLLTFHTTGEVVELAPGAIVKLNKGEPTTWVVTEKLRKVYVIDPNA
jgi:uncharacterized cupin superfamily protein